jgi:hypothetical protein
VAHVTTRFERPAGEVVKYLTHRVVSYFAGSPIFILFQGVREEARRIKTGPKERTENGPPSR